MEKAEVWMKFESRMNLEQACLIFFLFFFFFFDDLYVSICFSFLLFNFSILRAVCFVFACHDMMMVIFNSRRCYAAKAALPYHTLLQLCQFFSGISGQSIPDICRQSLSQLLLRDGMGFFVFFSVFFLSSFLHFIDDV